MMYQRNISTFPNEKVCNVCYLVHPSQPSWGCVMDAITLSLSLWRWITGLQHLTCPTTHLWQHTQVVPFVSPATRLASLPAAVWAPNAANPQKHIPFFNRATLALSASTNPAATATLQQICPQYRNPQPATCQEQNGARARQTHAQISQDLQPC